MSKTPRFTFRNIKLNLEELESRELPSASPAAPIVDPTTYASDRVLVRWINDAPVTAPFAASSEALGNNTYSVELASGESVTDAINWYQSQAGIDFAQADSVIQVSATANDYYASQQWALSNINASTAWNYTTGSKQIIVAVIDTGVDYTHSDLSANIWTNTREIAGNGKDDDGDGYVDDVYGYNFSSSTSNPMDDNGHGTHVAGIIGAVGNNSTGVAGVNWSVSIMSLKFMDSSGSGYTSNAVKAIYYAVNNGAKIINDSWGSGTYDSALASAIQYAQSKGVIVINAAGNSSTNIDSSPFYPASMHYSNVISVAASDQNNNLASFSNYGANTVDIAAPGVSILSTYKGNAYAYYSGTSMAAPYVAGAVALIWAENPNWTYTQVISDLLSNTTYSAGLAGKVKYGELNIGKAMQAAAPITTPAPYVTAAAFTGNGSSFSSMTITFSSAINSSTFAASDIVITGPDGARINVTSISAVAGSNNTQFTASFASQTKVGTYSAVIGPDIRDNYNRQMDQNRNGTSGEAADKYTLTGSLSGNGNFSTGNVNAKINDLQTTTSSITIGQHITIANLKVTLYVEHTYDSDLVITLVSPQGKQYILSNRRGGNGDNFTCTTFDSNADNSVTTGAAPFRSTYKPEDSLAGLAGQDAYGTWKLVVSDVCKNDTGTLVNWSLTVCSNGATRSQSEEGASEAAPAPADIPAKPELQSTESIGSSAITIAPLAWINSSATFVMGSPETTTAQDQRPVQSETNATIASLSTSSPTTSSFVTFDKTESESLPADEGDDIDAQLAAMFIFA